MKYVAKVKTGSSQEKVILKDDENLEIFTHARVHDNEANAAVIEILAKHFHVAKNQVKILRGKKSKIKIIEI